MGSVVLGIKQGVLIASESIVIVALTVSFVLGIYQIIREKIDEEQQVDEIATEILPDALKAH